MYIRREKFIFLFYGSFLSIFSQFVKKNQNQEKMIFKFLEFCKRCPVCTRYYHKGLQQATEIAKKLSKKAENLNKNRLIPFFFPLLRCKILIEKKIKFLSPTCNSPNLPNWAVNLFIVACFYKEYLLHSRLNSFF